MAFGLDYSMGMPPVADMKAAGVAFVCRYVGYFSGYNLNAIATPQGKCLTPGEAKTLLAGGMSPVSNYEWYATRPIDDGNGNRWTAEQAYTAGAWDAHTGNAIHLGCGGPSTAAIYLSGDWDFNTNTDGPLVAAYFKGAASAIGLARIGAYGGYWLIKFLFDNGLITYGWQTYAWSGGQWDPRAHIQQYSNGVNMSGLEVDYDRSIKSDYGQWTQGGTMVPANWKDANNILTAPNGVVVVRGFRDYVLNHNWDPANWPLAAEFSTGQLEASNTSIGAGDQQIFRWSMLGWTTIRGVFFEWIGQELAYIRQQVQRYAAQIQQLQAQAQTDAAQIAQLKAELAAAQTPTVQGVDPAAVKSFQTSAALKAHALVQGAQDLEAFITTTQV